MPGLLLDQGRVRYPTNHGLRVLLCRALPLMCGMALVQQQPGVVKVPAAGISSAPSICQDDERWGSGQTWLGAAVGKPCGSLRHSPSGSCAASDLSTSCHWLASTGRLEDDFAQWANT